ncbi:hypothetical protein IFM89_000291 [Coptis chinensis]|uniref:Serine-threonine/tyrosine-protein kinase catalytic domain-containing protein n=1 Tax=Coptis chinensis TaxID=261450 RepID=A0A835LH52_9MAGN|nr:hypothetical protein IFM89_000291 [Coptis chinensis]
MNVKQVVFQRNKFSSEALSELSEMLKKHDGIKEMMFSESRIGSFGVGLLASALKINESLEELQIWEDSIVGPLISTVLARNRTMEIHVWSGGNGEKSSKVVEFEPSNSALHIYKLDLSGCCRVACALGWNTTVRSLDMTGIRLKSKWAKEFRWVLEQNQSLREGEQSFRKKKNQQRSPTQSSNDKPSPRAVLDGPHGIEEGYLSHEESSIAESPKMQLKEQGRSNIWKHLSPMRLLFPFRSTFDGRVRDRSQSFSDKENRQPSWSCFSYEEISNATNHFHQAIAFADNIVGQGGYAVVYRGDLCDGRTIAVKRLEKDNTDENKQKEFLMEVGVLGHVCHPNTACLIGCCLENGLHLILNFLQMETCHQHYMITDFGLAKWLPKQWTHHSVIPIEGTFGYLAPEYFMHGIVDEKKDVFEIWCSSTRDNNWEKAYRHVKAKWFEWDVPESSEKHQVDLKSSEKMLTQLEDVGQQLAMTFSTDGFALAVGGEKHKKVEDISLKGIRVWQKKKNGEDSACSQKYGVPSYGAAWAPTNNIFNKQKPMENDEQDSELSSLRKGLSLISIFHHIHANAINITLNSIDVFNFLPTRTILKKWIRYYIDDKGLQVDLQAVGLLILIENY